MCPPLRDNFIRGTAPPNTVAQSRAHRVTTDAQTHVTVVPLRRGRPRWALSHVESATVLVAQSCD